MTRGHGKEINLSGRIYTPENTFLNMATQVVCRYNKFGFCKFKESCRILHVNDDPLCVLQECKKRHPKKCKFHRYNKCKCKENCAFSHDLTKPLDDESLKKFDQLETNLENANDEINSKLISNDKLVQMEIKIENFLKLEKEVCDAVIEGLEKKIKKIKKTC